MSRRGGARLLAMMLLVGVALPVVALPAAAATLEPTVNVSAWYWRDAESETVSTPGGSVPVETTNPYCPSPPGAAGSSPDPATCNEGRLPVWMKEGEADPPYMGSALDLDLSLVPQGATVTRFSLTMLEADCDPDDGRKDTPQCEAWTQPIRPNDYLVEVCEVLEIFGQGEARSYEESPRIKCPATRITGERRPLKAPVDKQTNTPYHLDDHIWVFDLTTLAQEWVEKFTIPTAIFLLPEQLRAPKRSDNFRVVFAGVEEKPARNWDHPVQQQPGIVMQLEYSGGDEGGFFPVAPPGGGGGSFGGGGGEFTTTTTGGGFGDTGTGIATTSDDTFGATTEEPSAAPAPEAAVLPTVQVAAEEAPAAEPLPGYVWLALLAGLVGFSLVRSVVLPAAAGVRPDGVLAQITRINAERRGTAAVAGSAAGPGPLDAVRRVAGSVAHGFKNLGDAVAGKLGLLKKH